MDRNRIAMRPYHRAYRLLVTAPPLLFLGMFYFYPMVSILSLSFQVGDGLGWTAFHKLWTESYYRHCIWFTTWQAAVSTVLTIILALPGAWIFARYRFPGKSLIKALTVAPFVLPTVVTAAAFKALLGSEGLINDMYNAYFGYRPIRLDQTIWFILLAHVFYNYAIVLRMVSSFWAGLDPAPLEAAKTLGASSLQAFRTITLPLLMPMIAAAGLLVFIFCFSSFGVVLLLGGPRYATIEVEIYRQAVFMFNLNMAAALSILQIAFGLGLMWIYTWIQRKTGVSQNPAAEARYVKTPKTRLEKVFIGGNLGFMALLLGTPLIALVLRSVITEDGISLQYYLALFDNPSDSVFFVPPINAVLNSLGIAAISTVAASILGLFAAIQLSRSEQRLSSVIDPLFMIPLVTSAVTLGFGFIIALDRPPLNLRTSIWLVPIAHTLAALPFVVRNLTPVLRSIPAQLHEAASILGASPFNVWRTIDFPIAGRAFIVGAVFAFTISLGEFGATVFTARPQTPTMPLAIYRFLGLPGSLNYGQAMAMSSLLMIITIASCVVLEKFRLGRAGEF